MSQGLEAPLVHVRPADGAARRDADFCLAVVAAVDVHVEHIFTGRVVVDDLGALDNAAGAQVAGTRLREQRADVAPYHEVCRRVAVDLLERRPVCLILPDHIVGRSDLDDTRSMGLDMFPGVCLFM